MTKNEFKEAVKRYIDEEATPLELAYIDKWYDAIEESSIDISDVIGEEVYTQIQTHIKSKKTKKGRIVTWSVRIAASLLFIVGGIGIFYLINHEGKEKEIAGKILGSDKAILKLADGSIIKLTDRENGKIGDEGGAHITMLDSGTIAYQSIDKNIPIKMNEVETPVGGKISLMLPDGSKVWLNSVSNIKFPTRFEGKERKVMINGEAYFEIAKNKEMPFIVEVLGKQKITVLGTHFNIEAYTDESEVSTTLMEGSIQVKTNSSNNAVVLKPGQQSVVSGKSISTRKDVDIQEVLAWKENNFLFNQTPMPEIAKDLTRWYGVEVIIDAAAKTETFSGKIPRSDDIQTLLKIFEKTNTIKYTIIGNQIKIYRKK